MLQREIERIAHFNPQPPDSLDIPALQRTLGQRGQVLVSYFFDEDVAFAFVVRQDTLAAVRLPAPPDTIRAHLARASGLWRNDDTSTSISLEELHTLYRLLFAPVAGLVPDESRLVIVPEDALLRLPFGLLVTRPHRAYRYASADYLIRHHPISTELSAALVLAPPSTRTDGDVLVLGRTRFDAPRPDLPRVADEVERIGVVLPGAHLFLDQTATEDGLEARLGSARLLHIASHALADPARPLYSRIELWDDPHDPDDGTLYLHELVGRRMDADLVVLSGCGTARGTALVGEGMLGLQHAFQASGARSTIATLWNAEDRATADLMARFYTALRHGLPKDVALQQAQLGYLDAHGDREATPFLWAGPVLYGDPSALPHLTAPAPSAAGWYAIGLALVALGLGIPRLRREAA